MSAKDELLERVKAMVGESDQRFDEKVLETGRKLGLVPPERPIWEVWSDQAEIAEDTKENEGEWIDRMLDTRQAIQAGKLSQPLPREHGMFNPNNPCDSQAQRKRAEAEKAEEEAEKRKLQRYRDSSRWIP